jgi:hypothetical protein
VKTFLVWLAIVLGVPFFGVILTIMFLAVRHELDMAGADAICRSAIAVFVDNVRANAGRTEKRYEHSADLATFRYVVESNQKPEPTVQAIECGYAFECERLAHVAVDGKPLAREVVRGIDVQVAVGRRPDCKD